MAMACDVSDEELRAIFANIDIALPPDPLEIFTEELGIRDVTTEELAAVLGVSDRRVAQLWQGGIIPEPRREGKRYFFPLLQSVSGYIHFLRQD